MGVQLNASKHDWLLFRQFHDRMCSGPLDVFRIFPLQGIHRQCHPKIFTFCPYHPAAEET